MTASQPTPNKRSGWPLHRQAIRHCVAALGPWFIALGMLLLRAMCRVRLHDDPRLALRTARVPYVYSVLHAQQLAAATCGDGGTAAMVSQSRDGALIVLGLKCVGIKPIRGSSRRRGRDNGGITALHNLIEHVRSGSPAYLAVDGPTGPRNRVHKGIAVLSQQTGATVLNVAVVPARRWIFELSWDRFQIPIPFCRIDTYFAAPIRPQLGESVEDYRRRIEASLNGLEALRDPAEAVRCPAHEHTYRREISLASSAA
jgi:lysophospholipid acyltransferase (LPLAT)-like uncharacterized protein